MTQKNIFRWNKVQLVVVGLSLGVLFSGPLSHAADTYNNKKTTTIEQTTTQTRSTAPAVRPAKKEIPVTTTTSNTTTSTTKEGDLRKVLDADALKKMSDSLCVTGFKAYVGNDKKNVCQGNASAPDVAYSCVWAKKGNAAFAPTVQGPCSLDYSEHQKSVVITKGEYTSRPPLAYGTEAHCCFRAARGPSTNTVERSPTTTTVEPSPK
ncbi:MAG: hypothetical protein A3I05_02850 [Deltaproteobacteria bacterium RIFCSPLOWO2_02_FULL_44_10]|nr:MAG: hypothetical protein A3C46_03510 [Deltaproteobacteria bacterium RIFCSPHIGHO2_02_FULL_44_16]OGQ46552.1 MAG: hypothetical protein A3I05_02850 [Deltaproteobacteria bacterium RIFCSPLOWO2_02_FULL_44_10]